MDNLKIDERLEMELTGTWWKWEKEEKGEKGGDLVTGLVV